MVLVISEQEVSKLANIQDVIERVEVSLKDYSSKKAIMPPRFVLERPGSEGTVRLMLASTQNQTGLKILTGTAGKRRSDGTYFLVTLFEKDGSIRALISANRLTQLRTGAASAVATKYLAREDSKILGIIGAGVQGQGQLEAITCVHSFESGLVFDIFEESAKRLISYARDNLHFDLGLASSATEVAKRSDVLVTTTTSREPFLTSAMVSTGTHINAVGSNLPGRREVHESLLKSSLVYVDSIEQVLKESGDLIAPIAAGYYSANQIAGEIGEVASGDKPGRTAKDQVTLFKSVGIAVEDVAVADLILQAALERKLGTEITL